MGSLYRLDPDGHVEPMLTGVGISNGIDWSADGSTMYFIDTLQHGVDTFRWDGAERDDRRPPAARHDRTGARAPTG